MIVGKTQMKGIGMQATAMNAQATVAGAMKSATKAMTTMNAAVDPIALQQTMAQFAQESEKFSMTQEMMDDTLDSMFDDEVSTPARPHAYTPARTHTRTHARNGQRESREGQDGESFVLGSLYNGTEPPYYAANLSSSSSSPLPTSLALLWRGRTKMRRTWWWMQCLQSWGWRQQGSWGR